MLVGTESLCTQSFCEQVLKCDSKLKVRIGKQPIPFLVIRLCLPMHTTVLIPFQPLQKIVSMITKELDALARNAIKEELKLIDPLSSSSKMSPIDIDWDNSNRISPVDI